MNNTLRDKYINGKVYHTLINKMNNDLIYIIQSYNIIVKNGKRCLKQLKDNTLFISDKSKIFHFKNINFDHWYSGRN